MIGFITERYGDSWNLDVNGPYPATLPALAFEGAQSGCTAWSVHLLQSSLTVVACKV